MRPHEPKIAALMALEEDLLSRRGRARIERHLAGCETCRRARGSMRVYSATKADVQVMKPAIDWSRIEASLAKEASQPRVQPVAELSAQRPSAVSLGRREP